MPSVINVDSHSSCILCQVKAFSNDGMSLRFINNYHTRVFLMCGQYFPVGAWNFSTKFFLCIFLFLSIISQEFLLIHLKKEDPGRELCSFYILRAVIKYIKSCFTTSIVILWQFVWKLRWLLGNKRLDSIYSVDLMDKMTIRFSGGVITKFITLHQAAQSLKRMNCLFLEFSTWYF